ncbi:MAG TPA: IPT/TIG domain-containing protein [Bryobacteraceae bacterium]|nr:IPT/TIG domain-containing protein [Bryobacteraceae bacterium]
MKKVIFLAIAAAGGLMAQTPTITAVLNTVQVVAGVKDTRLCPGIVATVFGTNFGSVASGVTVTVGGMAGAAITGQVTPNQMNVQIPFTAPVGSTQMVVTVGGQASQPFSITLLTAAPTIGYTAPGKPAFYTATLTQVTPAAPAHPGDTLVLFSGGMGQTNPASGNGPPANPVPLAGTPTMTIGGQSATIIAALYTASGYQFNFKVPTNVQGSVPVVISIDGQDSPPATLPLFGISAIVSGASFESTGTATPEEIVTIYANGMGSKDEITKGYQTTNVQGVSVTFNGTAAPIFALVTENGQLNAIVPTELPTSGTVQVELVTASGTSLGFPLIMNAAVPGIFLVPVPGNANATIAAAQFANTTWLAVPTSAAGALGLAQNCTKSKANPISNCGEPAAPGDYLVLYVTGLGEATPNGEAGGTPLATGTAAPASGSTLYETTAAPTVEIGGISAKPLFSGIAPGFAGLYQVDFQVPTGVPEGDSVPITISMPGSTTAQATIAIHSR